MKIYRSLPRSFILALAFLLFAGPLFAQRTITIKMATPIPENTPWGQFFNQMIGEWKTITNGEVELVVYHNGVAGSEKDVVRSLRVNQLQAAVLSSFGLFEIIPEIMTMSCPFLIRNDDELDLVLERVRGDLEQKLNAKGFTTISWAQVGWVKFFSKAPVFVPADLKRQRIGSNSDQEELNQVFKAMGFQMVPVARNDMLVALNSNMVDAVFQSPVAVGSTQVFGLAKNMASINVAPFFGAIVLNQRAWRTIPERYRAQLAASTRRMEDALANSVRELESEMIRTMGNYGLTVNHVTPAQELLWHEEIGRAVPSLLGTLFDRNLYSRIESIVSDHRSGRR